MTVVVAVYLLLLVLVNFGPSQQWLTDKVEMSLEEILQTKIEIERVEVGLFNRVTLHNVLIHDQHGEEMLKAGLLSAKIELAPLFHGMVSLRTVSALDANLLLYTNKKGENPNFQFVIDAFGSKEKKESSKLNLRINSIIFRRSNLTYDQKDQPETPGALNIAHLGVRNLDANISLKCLTNDSLNLRIRSLKLQEKSGLDVRALSLRMSANRKHSDISHFEMELPNSRLAKESLQADYALNDVDGFISTLDVNGALSDAKVSTDDIAFLVPQLRGVQQVVHLTTDFNVRPNQITFSDLQLKEERNQLQLAASACLNRVNGVITSVDAQVKRLFVEQGAVVKIAKSALGKPAPMWLENIGNVHFNGKVNYHKDAWSTLNGRLSSAAGILNADLAWLGKLVKGKANLEVNSANALLGRNDLPEQVKLHLNGQADFEDKAQPYVSGQIQLDEVGFRNIVYRDIVLVGELKRKHLTLQTLSANPSADFTLNFSSILNGKTLSDLRLNASVRDFHPQKLNLSNFFGDYAVASNINAGLSRINLQSPEGWVHINDFKLNGEIPYHLKKLNLTTRSSKSGTFVNMRSDFGELKMDGPLSLPKFKAMLTNLVGEKLPGWMETKSHIGQHKWKFNLKLTKSDFFQQVLHLPIQFNNGIEAEGFLSSGENRVFLSAVANDLAVNSTQITNLRVLLRDLDKELLSRVQLNKVIGKENLHFELENVTHEGRLQTDLSWSDFKKGSYSGVFKTETQFSEDNTVCTRIQPTSITIRDSIWNILPGEIKLLGDNVDINRFEVQHEDQGIKLYGKLSKRPEDELAVELNKIDLEYILSMVNLGSFTFGGLATGKIALANTLDSLQVHAKLSVPDFRFNGGFMGNADIYGDWNIGDKRLNLLGDIQEKGWGHTKVTGYVDLAKKGLDLRIDSKNTNVYCLNRYVEGIFDDLQGRTSGYCRVYGPFGGIDFEGDETASLSAEIGATGVRYDVFGGKVVMSPGKFGFQNMNVSDNIEGRGKLNGELLHHHLKNIRYNMDVDAQNLLVYDKDQSVDMPFYATTFGTGKIRLKGRPGNMEADIMMRPERNTMFVYTVDTPEGMGDVQLLKFADAADTLSRKDMASDKEKKVVENTSSIDIRLNFLVDMNPEATLKVIMDRKTGDHLIVHGYGPLRASFYNKGDFQMFGKLNVDRGTYKMSIQDVIRKDFEFTRGSFINFSGNPFEGDLGLRAIYTVNSASLSDLNIGNSLSDNSVRVNCVLNFSGKVKSPQVSFDLELPTVSEDVQQMVRNLISSEEDMNMQILYLLGVGRFYTYNYSTTANAETQSQSAVAMKSFLSNTLSSQLNNIISNAVGSSNWSFGANLSTGEVGWSDMEVEGILSGRLLNNRLLINGNFGYRDRPTYSSTANFVGDFDVRYLLTPGGGVSLKAYSETNDRYFSKSSLSTQGIGLLLKRDFSSLKDLFSPRKKKSAQKDKNKAEMKQDELVE